jgi:hypothetical protein
MKQLLTKRSAILQTVFLCSLAATHLQAEDCVVLSPEGAPFVLEVAPQDSFTAVIGHLQQTFGGDADHILDFRSGKHIKQIAAVKQHPIRDYLSPVTLQEKRDIAYIINTLGMSSLVTIATTQSSIKEAGDRIDHVHPLRFLISIFSDEKMKASISAMKGRRWVWGDFIQGLKESADCETSRGNMKPEFIQDFIIQLNLDPKEIAPLVNKH